MPLTLFGKKFAPGGEIRYNEKNEGRKKTCKARKGRGGTMKKAEIPETLGGVETPMGERAWDRTEIRRVLDFGARQGYILLGGEVLTEGLANSGESWHYDPEWDGYFPRFSQENSRKSVEKAREYISNYLDPKAFFTLTWVDALTGSLMAR